MVDQTTKDGPSPGSSQPSDPSSDSLEPSDPSSDLLKPLDPSSGSSKPSKSSSHPIRRFFTFVEKKYENFIELGKRKLRYYDPDMTDQDRFLMSFLIYFTILLMVVFTADYLAQKTYEDSNSLEPLQKLEVEIVYIVQKDIFDMPVSVNRTGNTIWYDTSKEWNGQNLTRDEQIGGFGLEIDSVCTGFHEMVFLGVLVLGFRGVPVKLRMKWTAILLAIVFVENLFRIFALYPMAVYWGRDFEDWFHFYWWHYGQYAFIMGLFALWFIFVARKYVNADEYVDSGKAKKSAKSGGEVAGEAGKGKVTGKTETEKVTGKTETEKVTAGAGEEKVTGKAETERVTGKTETEKVAGKAGRTRKRRNRQVREAKLRQLRAEMKQGQQAREGAESHPETPPAVVTPPPSFTPEGTEQQPPTRLTSEPVPRYEKVPSRIQPEMPAEGSDVPLEMEDHEEDLTSQEKKEQTAMQVEPELPGYIKKIDEWWQKWENELDDVMRL